MTTQGTVLSNPIPPYQNLPIEPQFFQPSQFFISGVSLGITTTVTTTVNHNYVVGQQVRLLIPSTSGCRQLNEKSAYVISIPSANQVVIDLNTSNNVDAFTSSSASNQPQILAIGDILNGQINANGRSNSGTYVPGSFQNISP